MVSPPALAGATMQPSDLTGPRLAAVFLLGSILLNYPILSIFAPLRNVAGIPVLYAYVFGAWVLLIGLMAFFVERRDPP
jgi:hypothetical protein